MQKTIKSTARMIYADGALFYMKSTKENEKLEAAFANKLIKRQSSYQAIEKPGYLR